jgi:hypothetical protein
MTTNYMGMTPWQYNEWARSRETDGGPGGISSRTGWGYIPGPNVSPPVDPNDPYKNIDRSPFELGPKDAITLAQQQRIRDATDYRYNLAGLPVPIDVFSGSLADTQRANLPLGIRASLMPGTGAFAPSAALRNYALARDAYMSDPIRAAQNPDNDGDIPLPGTELPPSGGWPGQSGSGTGGWTGGWTGAG